MKNLCKPNTMGTFTSNTQATTMNTCKKTDLRQDELLHWFVPHPVQHGPCADGTEAGSDHSLLQEKSQAFIHHAIRNVHIWFDLQWIRILRRVIWRDLVSIRGAVSVEKQHILLPGRAGKASPSHCSEARTGSHWETPPVEWWPPGGGPWNPGRWPTHQREQARRGQAPSQSLSPHPDLPLGQRGSRDYCAGTCEIYYYGATMTVSSPWWRPSESGRQEGECWKKREG